MAGFNLHDWWWWWWWGVQIWQEDEFIKDLQFHDHKGIHHVWPEAMAFWSRHIG